MRVLAFDPKVIDAEKFSSQFVRNFAKKKGATIQGILLFGGLNSGKYTFHATA